MVGLFLGVNTPRISVQSLPLRFEEWKRAFEHLPQQIFSLSPLAGTSAKVLRTKHNLDVAVTVDAHRLIQVQFS